MKKDKREISIVRSSAAEYLTFITATGESDVNAVYCDENVWLTQKMMGLLYNVETHTINYHLKKIFADGEIDENSVIRKFRITAADGKNYNTNHYNLSAIIAVGNKVDSPRAVQFRKWANRIIEEFTVKGFAMDDERLKNLGGGSYWKELLDRIRDIRSSEKVLYRQVLDVYATSVDYDPRTEASRLFFKIVQNKLHYAAHGHTAAEVIYERADADKPFMGLMSFKGELPCLNDIKIAKNYLDEKEIKILNNIVSGYFDFAEIMALEHKPVYMMDYVKQLDSILMSTGRPLLQGTGTVSHEEAMEKALAEYRKYQVETLSPVEQAYLDSIKMLGKKGKGE